jgi:predicted nucleic acid-binding protein
VPERYVLDTSALMAFFQNEPGADTIKQILNRARGEKCQAVISFITLTELYYILWQEEGESAAKELLAHIKSLPVMIIESHERLTLLAGRIKATFRLSLADAFVAATASIVGGTLVHKDPELEQVKKLVVTEPLPFKIGRKRHSV